LFAVGIGAKDPTMTREKSSVCSISLYFAGTSLQREKAAAAAALKTMMARFHSLIRFYFVLFNVS